MARTIIVPLDGSALAEAAMPHAAELARLMGDSIHLVRVHVPVLAYAAAESPVAFPDPAWDAQVHDAAAEWLVKKAAELRAIIKAPLTFELRVGMPADEIVTAARERDTRAIVCTTHGHGGWAAQWLGSVADAVIRHSPCPVLAMSERAVPTPAAITNILVPLDGSETAEAILPHVKTLARASNATVDLYRVVAPPWVGDALTALHSGEIDRFGLDAAADVAKTELDHVAEDLKFAGIHITTCVEVATNPTRAILDRISATNPDLVAMSTHGRGLSRLFLGSVADKILRAGGRPLLCWRAPRVESADADGVGMFATSVSGPTA